MFSVIKKAELEKVIGGKEDHVVDISIKTSWGDYVAKWTGVSKEGSKPTKPTPTPPGAAK